jgi:hypothetical protein
MPAEERVVRYTLTRKDLIAFNLYALLRNRMIQLSVVVAILVAIYFAYEIFHLPPPPGQPEFPRAVKIAVSVVVIFLLLAAYLACMSLALFFGTRANKFKNLLCEHELRLTETGMLSRSATAETMRKWNGLSKLRSTRNYLFLYVNETTAQVVPKRFFNSPAEAQSFEQMIREWMKTG